MRNFLDISDLSPKELRTIIEEAKVRKSNRKELNKSEPDLDKPFQEKQRETERERERNREKRMMYSS